METPAEVLGPLLVVVGVTASGKSALAMELAKKFNGEIITADSWTVYKGFDIATAKPSRQDRKQIPHHLVDITDAWAGFSAAEFKRLASQAIEDITSRNKLPILVGGSGLYINSILFDYSFLPAGPPKRRQQLNALSLDQLQKKVSQAGFDTSSIDINNKRRLIRLIETKGELPKSSSLRPNTLILGLTIPKNELKNRINLRIDIMFKQSLVTEVKHLAEIYGWNVEPIKGIGYREFQDYFNGTQTLEQTKIRIINSTLKLAKKQKTWFKRNKSIHWLNDKGKAVDLVTTLLNK